MEQNQSNQKQAVELNKVPMYMQYINSFRGAKRYPPYLSLSTGKVVGYFFFLTAIVTLLSAVVPTIGYIVGIGGIGQYLQDHVPEFSLQNGILTMGEPVEYETNGMRVYINSEVERYTKADLNSNLSMEVLAGRYNAVMNSGGMVSEINYKDYSALSMDKQGLLKNTPIFYLSLVFVFVVAYVSQAIYIISTVLLLAVIGLMSNSMYQFKLQFGQLMRLAVYATTILSTLEAVNAALNLISVTIASVVGMVWTAFVFFGAVTVCGQLKNMGKIQ